VVSRPDLFLGEAMLEVTLARTIKEKRKHTTHCIHALSRGEKKKKKANRKNGRYNP
jgi:hypothetical protein